ncbi:MAG: fimbrillin family protein [Bacteroidales bacterium]|nr:fimbrillin family protein [Bacteroidales bacterium]
MKKIIYIVPLLALLASSCGKDSPVKDNDEIQFMIGYPSTKATVNSFEKNDVLSLWAVEQNGDGSMPLQVGGNYINNEKLTFDGSQWKGAKKLYWSDSSCDFYAIYPYQKTVTSVEEQPFSVQLDQNATTDTGVDGYEASDLLFASAKGVSRSNGAVSLQFKHMLSKITIRLIKGEQFDGEIPDDVETHIYNTSTTGLLDIQRGSITKNDLGPRGTITARKVSNSEFEAIVLPQNIETRTPLIEVTMGGIAYLLEYSLSLRPGYHHKIDLTLNTSPDQEQIEISIDPGIEGWN